MEDIMNDRIKTTQTMEIEGKGEMEMCQGI